MSYTQIFLCARPCGRQGLHTWGFEILKPVQRQVSVWLCKTRWPLPLMMLSDNRIIDQFHRGLESRVVEIFRSQQITASNLAEHQPKIDSSDKEE